MDLFIEPISRGVWVSAGCFQMGCVSGMQCRNLEKPVHEVYLDGFWMGTYEVTQAQWQRVMGENPSYFNEAKLGRDTSNYPVEGGSWNDVQEFFQKVNARVEHGTDNLQTFLLRLTETWHQLSKEEQDSLMAKVDEALEAIGGKRIVTCDSGWASEQWPFFGTEFQPS